MTGRRTVRDKQATTVLRTALAVVSMGTMGPAGLGEEVQEGLEELEGEDRAGERRLVFVGPPFRLRMVARRGRIRRMRRRRRRGLWGDSFRGLGAWRGEASGPSPFLLLLDLVGLLQIYAFNTPFFDFFFLVLLS